MTCTTDGTNISFVNGELLTVGKWYAYANPLNSTQYKILITIYNGIVTGGPNTILYDVNKKDTCEEVVCSSTPITTTSTTSTTSTTTSTTSTTTSTTTTTTAAPTTTSTTTSTTTTTTIGCITVGYGFGYDAASACANFEANGPTDYQWDGTTLYEVTPFSPCGPFANLAEYGYYSNGTNVYFWDQETFIFDSTCVTDYTVTFMVRRSATGSMPEGQNLVDVRFTDDPDAPIEYWSSFSGFSGFSPNTNFTMPLGGSVQLPAGTPLYVGMKGKPGFVDIGFDANTDPNDYRFNDSFNFTYCGTYPPIESPYYGCYYYGVVNSNITIYLQAVTGNGGYIQCTPN